MPETVEVLKLDYVSEEAKRNAEALRIELAEVTTYALAQAAAFKSTGEAIEVYGATYDVLPSKGEEFRESQRRAREESERLAEQLRREVTETERLATSWRAATGVLPLATAEFRDLAQVIDVTRTASQRAADATGQLVIVSDQAAAGGSALGRAFGSGGAGRSILEFSRLAEDAQYGIAGVLNNVPTLVMALGGAGGLAGVISLVVVGANQLYKHWDDIAGLWRQGDTEAEAERLKHVSAETDKATASTQKLNAEKEHQAELEKLLATQADKTKAAQQAGAQATQAAVGQVGGPKFLADLQAAIEKYYQAINDAARIGPLRDFQKAQAKQQAQELTLAAQKGDAGAMQNINEFLRLAGGKQADIAAPVIGNAGLPPAIPGDVEAARARDEAKRQADKVAADAKARAKLVEELNKQGVENEALGQQQLLREQTEARTDAQREADARRRKNLQVSRQRDEPLVQGLVAGAGLPIEALLQRNTIGRAQGARGAVSDAQAADVLTQRLALLLQQTGTDRDPLHARATAEEVVKKAQQNLAQKQAMTLGQTQNLQAATLQTMQQLANDLANVDARTAVLWQQLAGVRQQRQQVVRTAQNRAR